MNSEWNSDPDDTTGAIDSSSDFQRSLEGVLLDAFARGISIEQQWEIPAPVSGAPGWSVDITRTSDGREPNHIPDLLDE